MRILMFVAFLLLYLGWLRASMAVGQLAPRKILQNKTLLIGQLSLLVTLAAVFVFLFVLTRFFDWRLMAALFVVGEAAVLLTSAVGGFFESADSRWGARAAWAGGEFAFRHQPATAAMTILMTLIVFAYPIAVGVIYFRADAAILTTRVFQYTLIMTVLCALPMTMVFLLGALLSENIDEETRTRFLIAQLSALLPNALWLTLLLWSFGKTGVDRTVNIGDVALKNVSPSLILALVAFFVVVVLLPYLVGAQRAKRWRRLLLKRRKDLLQRLLDILQTPAGNVYLGKIAALQADVQRQTEELIAGDPMIQAGTQIDAGSTPPAVVSFVPAYRLARGQDPRFQYLDFLKATAEKIEELRADLATLTTTPELEASAKEWVVYLRPREAALTRELSETAKSRTPAILLASTIIVPIFSVLLSEFAKWLWVYFSKSLPQ